MKYKILLSLAALNFLSCQKSKPLIVSKQGQIEMIVNTYYDPINDFEGNSQHFLVGTINYNSTDLIEEVPENIYDLEEQTNVFRYHITEDKKQFTLIDQNDFIFNNPEQPYFDIKEKPNGFSFDQTILTNYENRIELKDTIYNERVFKRFYLFDKDKENLTSFEIMLNDTIYPYSASELIEADYNGKISKIETYNQSKNIYSTIYFNYINGKISDEAKEIFKYNDFIKEQN